MRVALSRQLLALLTFLREASVLIVWISRIGQLLSNESLSSLAAFLNKEKFQFYPLYNVEM